MSKSVATQSAIANLITAFIGSTVMVTDKDNGDAVAYKVASLSSKLGSLKDGTKGEYVVLQKADDEAIVISLHPQAAKTLFTKGESAGMQVLPAEPVKKARKEKAPEVKAEAPAEPKEPSKKELFVAAYKSVSEKVAQEGGEASTVRQLVKAEVASLGLSDPGFNTYYQNCKSQKWL